MNLFTKLMAAVLENCPPGQNALPNGDPCQTNLPNPTAGNEIQTALQVAFAIIGAVALIYLVVAGLKFVISSGNPEQVAKARQAIIYAAVGLVIAASAELIVTFIIGST